MARDVAASAVTILLGVWLLATSVLWAHSGPSAVNVLVVAAACVTIGLVSLRAPRMLLLDFLLAAWLVVSIWLVPERDPFSAWNAMMVAIGLALLPISERLFPSVPGERRATV